MSRDTRYGWQRTVVPDLSFAKNESALRSEALEA